MPAVLFTVRALKFSINHSSTAMRTGQAVLVRKLARFHKRSATDLFRFSKWVKGCENKKKKFASLSPVLRFPFPVPLRLELRNGLNVERPERSEALEPLQRLKPCSDNGLNALNVAQRLNDLNDSEYYVEHLTLNLEPPLGLE